MVNADTTTKEQSEQSDRMRHFVVKSVLLYWIAFGGFGCLLFNLFGIGLLCFDLYRKLNSKRKGRKKWNKMYSLLFLLCMFVSFLSHKGKKRKK